MIMACKLGLLIKKYINFPRMWRELFLLFRKKTQYVQKNDGLENVVRHFLYNKWNSSN